MEWWKFNFTIIPEYSFFSFFIYCWKIKFLFISSLRKEWNNGGSGYKASLNNKYLDKPAIFVSTIENENCILEIYQNHKVQKQFIAGSPDEVWKLSNSIKQYKGIQLFGLENSFTQNLIQQNLKPHVLQKTGISFLY